MITEVGLTGCGLSQKHESGVEAIIVPQGTLEARLPTTASAQRMFDEYDYQAAAQFYIWAYSYINGLDLEKGLSAMGGE